MLLTFHLYTFNVFHSFSNNSLKHSNHHQEIKIQNNGVKLKSIKTAKLMHLNYEYRFTTPPLGGWGAE